MLLVNQVLSTLLYKTLSIIHRSTYDEEVAMLCGLVNELPKCNVMWSFLHDI